MKANGHLAIPQCKIMCPNLKMKTTSVSVIFPKQLFIFL